ncbi:MAG TPA: hypothetical protein VHX38_21925 [Pseudonocardiaceae bacterium]|nr:hypothetical protein [Pseudonocardiaceae bacterium]
MLQHPELTAIHRAVDELSRAAHDLRHRFGNTLDVCRFAEDVSRLRADSALLARSLPVLTATASRRSPIPDQDYDRTLWRHDDEGLGGFASTLGDATAQVG